jgi:hypothetical protein
VNGTIEREARRPRIGSVFVRVGGDRRGRSGVEGIVVVFFFVCAERDMALTKQAMISNRRTAVFM